MGPEIMREEVLPVRAMMPYPSFREVALVLSECDRRLVFVHQRHGPAAEQFRRISSRLANHHQMGGTLMVTSPAPEDGKTLTALNLAMCLAERAPVLLVDLDTRRSTVGRKLGLPVSDACIEEVLAEEQPPESCVVSIQGTRLCVAMNKGEGHNVIDLMAVGRPKRFLDWAQRKFAWIILDTPPTFPIADTLEIANHASIGMLVVRARKTPAPLVKLAIEALKGRIQYVVFNDSEAPSYAAYDRNFYFSSDGGGRRW